MSKSFWKSRTLWFNVGTILLAIGNVLPPDYSLYVVAVGNMILRIFTDKPLTLAKSS